MLGSASDWAELVQRISDHDRQGVEDLYAALADRVRAELARRMPPDCCDDGVHDILLIVLQAIRRGELRNPERLLAFIRTVTHRHAIAHIRHNIFHRSRFSPDAAPPASLEPSPEALSLRRERDRNIREMLARLQARDREILERFYLRDQNPDQICREMVLTPTQFRLSKSRALARCARAAQSTRFLWMA